MIMEKAIVTNFVDCLRDSARILECSPLVMGVISGAAVLLLMLLSFWLALAPNISANGVSLHKLPHISANKPPPSPPLSA